MLLAEWSDARLPAPALGGLRDAVGRGAPGRYLPDVDGPGCWRAAAASSRAGALLFQNAVQATAADILREALVAADEAGLDIILSVHDEVVGIGPYEDGEKLNAIMLRQPAWAAGLPLATGGVSSGRRYGK